MAKGSTRKEKGKGEQPVQKNPSMLHLLNARQYGRKSSHAMQRTMIRENCGSLIGAFTEREYVCNRWDKAFACAWLTTDTVMIGTKCNTLIRLNVDTAEFAEIPLPPAPPRPETMAAINHGFGHCGIHALTINASNDLLATGGRDATDCVVFKLPTMEPVATLAGHVDWIFGIAWMTERHLLTASRDKTIKLWSINPEEAAGVVGGLAGVGGCPLNNSMMIAATKKQEGKVRDIRYCPNLGRAASLNLGKDGKASVKFWTPTLQRERTAVLHRPEREVVCLALQDNVAAVGSLSHVTLLDTRVRRNVCHIRSPESENGIRSVDIDRHLLSFGSAKGHMFFYDLRAKKFHLQPREQHAAGAGAPAAAAGPSAGPGPGPQDAGRPAAAPAWGIGGPIAGLQQQQQVAGGPAAAPAWDIGGPGAEQQQQQQVGGGPAAAAIDMARHDAGIQQLQQGGGGPAAVPAPAGWAAPPAPVPPPAGWGAPAVAAWNNVFYNYQQVQQQSALAAAMQQLQQLQQQQAAMAAALQQQQQGVAAAGGGWQQQQGGVAAAAAAHSADLGANGVQQQHQQQGVSPNYRLRTGRGWLDRNEMYRQHFSNQEVANACYSMAWDPSRTRLFTCGGPLVCVLKGCYMGLWS